ncbi:MAG TPA: transcription elongation factor GreB [Kofleriaceae bacterium]
MTRARTPQVRDEEDADGDPTAKPKKHVAYITAEGAAKLKEEHDHLWLVERPRVTQAVSDAAALGDRSENADYIYGKRRLREIDRRLRFLTKRLETVRVVNETPADPGRVFFGAWVTLEDEDGEKKTWRIVGADESDMSRGYISMDSPVAKALLGKRLDDELTIRVPKGDVEYTIVGVKYAP